MKNLLTLTALVLCRVAFAQHQCFIDTTPVAPAAFQQELSAGPYKI